MSADVKKTARQTEAGPTTVARAAAGAALPKRFYLRAERRAEEGGFALFLDGKPAMTPGRKPLRVPTRRLAAAIEAEWNEQGERIVPSGMPVTRLANSAIDGVAEQMAEVRGHLLAYGGADLLFFRAGSPAGLVERQRLTWDPILGWAEARFGVRFALAEGVIHVAQPSALRTALAKALDAFDEPFRLAGLSLATTLTGSLLIALALAERALDADAAWAAAHVDEDWNIKEWGEEAEAARRRAARRADFGAAALALTPE